MGSYQLLRRDFVYAIKALHFLALAARPVLLPEVADFIAMDIGRRRVDVDMQFLDAKEILTICSSLVTSSSSSWRYVAGVTATACEDALRYSERSESFVRLENDSVEEIRLAHLSVKEWLTSSTHGNIICGPLLTGPDLVAQTCLAYLLQFDTPRNFMITPVEESPLLNYAVYHWLHHLEISLSSSGSSITKQIACDLLRPNLAHFLNVAFIYRCKFEHRRFRSDLWPTSYVSPNKFCDASTVSSSEEMDFASPIYWAARFGASHVCQLLITEGADINVSGGRYLTPLLAAIEEHRDATVQILVSKGAEIEVKDGQWHSPLQRACVGLSFEIVKILLCAGVNVNAVGNDTTSALALAARSGDNGAIVKLHGACGSWRGCNFGNEAAVRLLLDHGANVHDGEDTGETALAAAVGQGNLPAIRLLVEKGSDVNVKNNDWGTLLMHAFNPHAHMRSLEAILRYLIDNGADVRAQIEGHLFGNALFTALACKVDEPVVRLLLDAGADASISDGTGKVPLQAAIESDQSDEVVSLLLQHGADVNGLSRHQGTALQSAASNGRIATVALLVNQGEDVNKIGGPYTTALCGAAYNGHHKVVRFLIEAGAEIERIDGHGWTAIRIAKVQGHDCVLKEFSEERLNSRLMAQTSGISPDALLVADPLDGAKVLVDGLNVSTSQYYIVS
jgi:ankyrin repeat protein